MRRVCCRELRGDWPVHLWVSDDGRLWSDKSQRWLSGGCLASGYRVIRFGKTSTLLHRIVALAFVPNPDGKPFVNHIDGDKTNNHYSNLEWVTRIENERHASELGLKVHKLSRESVVKIQHFLKGSCVSIPDLAKKFDVPPHSIRQINDGKTWMHVGNFEYPLREINRRRHRGYLSDEKVERVRVLLGDGMSYRKIQAAEGVARDTIKRIKDGEL